MSKLFKGFVIAVFLVTLANCEGCFRNGAKRDADVASCAVYNNSEDKCNAATENKVRCHYDRATGKCNKSPNQKEKDCAKLTMQECKASKYCSYLEATSTCGDADPALAGKCEVMQDETSCKANTNCIWNETSLVCQDKK